MADRRAGTGTGRNAPRRAAPAGSRATSRAGAAGSARKTTAARKPAARKAPARTTAAGASARKSPARKPAAPKAAAGKSAARKPAASKAAARKPAARKPAARKAPARTTPARKAPARKPARTAPARKPAARRPAPPQDPRSRRRSRRRGAFATVVVLVLLGAMTVGPLQTLLAANQRVEVLASSREQLQSEVDRLEDRRDDLHDPEELELIARRELGLVKPGEEPYVVVRPEDEVEQIAPDTEEAAAIEDPWYRQLGRAIGLVD